MEPGLLSLGGLFLLTLFSEDAAVLSGGFLATEHPSSWWGIFLACFLGVWLGDIALFLLARIFGKAFINLLFRDQNRVASKLAHSEEWFRRYGPMALIGSRFLPGMRLITYLSAGLLRMKITTFASITGIAAAFWVAGIFWIVKKMGQQAPGLFQLLRTHLAFAVLAMIGIIILPHLLPRAMQVFTQGKLLRKFRQWEFWPASIFYLPVAINYIRLALIHRSLTLPSSANPGMFTGGLIGESKYETLRDLQQTSPEFIAQSHLIPKASEAEGGENRLSLFKAILAQGKLTFPLVFKPDIGQRGSGFKVIHSLEKAAQYLQSVPLPIVAQQYIPGPNEVGIFYYRFPHESKGRILAMTEKIFPMLIGDGRSTLEELILADPRAALIAETYLKRFCDQKNRVLPAGEAFRLVEAGNHIQGCIFANGMRFWSKELEERVDEISQKIGGFFIGRYDVRYSSPELLVQGKGFHILELNGASAEATSAYDASQKLSEAYRLLFCQWDLVFAIGAANRKLGHRPDSAWKILSAWNAYRTMSICHPQAD